MQAFDSLTDYQKAQLLRLASTGELAYTTSRGTKVPRPTWRKMVSALLESGAVDGRMRVQPAARAWLEVNHQSIDTSVL